MACESFVEHLVGPLYFLQRTLFLRFSQISKSLAIYLYLRAGVLACRGWLFSYIYQANQDSVVICISDYKDRIAAILDFSEK